MERVCRTAICFNCCQSPLYITSTQHGVIAVVKRRSSRRSTNALIRLLLLLLSTQADRQGGYIVYCLFVCVFVRLRISPPMIKLAKSILLGGSSASKAGNRTFCENLLLQKPKIGRISQRAGHARWPRAGQLGRAGPWATRA